MKREMKSNLNRILILLCITLLFTSCSFLQKKSKKVVTPEEVYTAVFLDDSYSLNKYLAEGFPIDYRDENNKTLLMNILEKDSLNSLNIILTRDINLEDRDDNGRTAIFYVRSIEALKSLVTNGADINAISLKNSTPLLIYFMKEKSDSYSKYLLENGVNFKAKDKNGWDVTFWSASIGDIELVRDLEHLGADFLALDEDGNYPIYYAYDENTVLELLNVKGYNLKLKNNKGENIFGEIYLRSVANGNLKAVERLIDLGVNPRYISYGDSAKSIATKLNNLEMLKLLKEKGIK